MMHSGLLENVIEIEKLLIAEMHEIADQIDNASFEIILNREFSLNPIGGRRDPGPTNSLGVLVYEISNHGVLV